VIEVVSDGGLAIIAGSHTTSSALSNLFYLLLANPVVYRRLQAEIDDLGDNAMDFARQAHMTYLNAAMYIFDRPFSNYCLTDYFLVTKVCVYSLPCSVEVNARQKKGVEGTPLDSSKPSVFYVCRAESK